MKGPLPRRLALAAVAAALPLAASAAPCPSGMILVPGGTLSAEYGPVPVDAFCLDRTEVTAAAYATCAQAGACRAVDLECGNAATYGRKGLEAHPVNCVTWDEAATYCSEHGKRLPTEEEWEWAARGGARGATFPWGEEPPAERACWDGDGNAKGKGKRKGTCPVASHPRSRTPDGLHDLAGNVREWTASEHERFRVLRGGSWGDSLPEFLAAGFRGWNAPDERMELLGFRCAAAPGTIARWPVRRDDPPRAEKDDAGVLILSAPMELGRRGKR